MNNPNKRYSRRRFIALGTAGTAANLLAACGGINEDPRTPIHYPLGTPATEIANSLPPTPECDDGDEEETATFIEGPYYRPTTPQKTSFLDDGLTGPLLILSGQVLNTQCQPLSGAVLDIWHCDTAGAYDNRGFKLRGHQFTDSNGRWQLSTILPAPYEGRPRHIHIKVQGANTPLLTTQLFFPEDIAAFKASPDFSEDLVISVIEQTAEQMTATFNFVLTPTA